MNFSRDRRRKILSPFYFYSSLSLLSLSSLSLFSLSSLSLTRALVFNVNRSKRADDECLSLSLSLFFHENKKQLTRNVCAFFFFLFLVALELGFKGSHLLSIKEINAQRKLHSFFFARAQSAFKEEENARSSLSHRRTREIRRAHQ